MKTKKESQDYADKNETIQRLMAFVESKGRPSAIAKMIGMSDNIFSNMVKRDAKPSSDLIVSLAQAFPDLDIHYILLGFPMPIVSELKRTVREREEEANYHKSVVKQFVGKYKGEALCPGKNNGFGQIVYRDGKRRYLINPGLTLRPTYANA